MVGYDFIARLASLVDALSHLEPSLLVPCFYTNGAASVDLDGTVRNCKMRRQLMLVELRTEALLLGIFHLSPFSGMGRTLTTT